MHIDAHFVCTMMCICTGVLLHAFRTIKCNIFEERESTDSSALNPGAVAGIVCAVLLVGAFCLGELFSCGTYPVNMLASVTATIRVSAVTVYGYSENAC